MDISQQQQKSVRLDNLKRVLVIEVVYLLVLLLLAIIYSTDLRLLLPFALPNSLGSLPIGIPWFGALGAVVISLTGVFDHKDDWDPSWRYWHYTRPLIGCVLAIIATLIFQAGVVSVGTLASPAARDPQSNILFYLIAFVVGYREEVFRRLIKRLADVILTPGDNVPVPAIAEVRPATGPSTGNQDVVVLGSGFVDVTSVRFGATPAATFRVDSASQITAPAPPSAPGTVSVTVATKTGSVTGGVFTYE